MPLPETHKRLRMDKPRQDLGGQGHQRVSPCRRPGRMRRRSLTLETRRLQRIASLVLGPVWI